MHNAVSTCDTSGAKAKIEAALSFIYSKDFQYQFKREIAADLRRIIKRTQAGRDLNDVPFEKYSDEYRAAKISKGRKGDVDLTLSGRMLQALQIDTQIEEQQGIITGSIFMSGAEAEKARRHIAGDGVPKRNFMGFSREFSDRINKLIRKFISHGR